MACTDPAPVLEDVADVPEELSSLVRRCLDKSPTARPDAAQMVQALRDMLTVGGGGAPAHGEVNPFRGLLPFDERHSQLFFGREDDIAAAVERLRTLQTVLPVVGPSGAGKSSFVQAGLIPRLREHGPLGVIQLRPGARPLHLLAARFIDAWQGRRSGPFGSAGFSTGELDEARGAGQQAAAGPGGDPGFPLEPEALAAQLHERPQLLNLLLHRLAERAGASVVLYVDQLEELYTLVEDAQERSRFMQAVCSAADDVLSPVRVIFSLREEFLSRLAEGGSAREALSHITVLRPPGREALVEILVCPVEAMGYDFDDPDMVQEMVAEVEGEVACLPLLQFAGQVLWERRDQVRQELRHDDAREMGGVAGALARHADGTLKGLTPDELRQARNLLLRLVTPEGTRRVISRQRALQGLGGGAAEVLARLVDSRLVVVRQAQGEGAAGAALELVHESLVSGWGRLRRWIDESREELVFLAEVGEAADLWARRGERAEEVWQGPALHDARRALDSCTTEVSLAVRRFIAAGERKERHAGRRRRVAVITLVVALSLVAAGALLAALAITEQKRRATERMLEAQRRKAAAQHATARAALSRGELLEARANLRGALEILDTAPVRALWWRLRREPGVWRHRLGGLIYRVSYATDSGSVAAGCQDHSIYLIDAHTRGVRVLRGHKDQVFAVDHAPGGRVLASGTWGGEVGLWDLQHGKLRLLKPHAAGIASVQVSPDGKLLATASWDKSIHLYDLPGGKLRSVLAGHAGPIYDVRFTPDSRLLISGAVDGVRVWEVGKGKQVRQLEGGTSLAVSPDGKWLATLKGGLTVQLVSMKSWKVERRMTGGHTRPIQQMAFSPDGKQLATGGLDDTARLWDLASGKVVRVLTGHTSGIWGLDFSPDGKWLVTGGMDHTVRQWRVGAPGAGGTGGAHRAMATRVAYSPDGKLVASGSYDKDVRLWDAATGRSVRVLRGHRATVHSVRFSPDGKLLASGGDDQEVRLWEVSTGRSLRVMRGHRVSIWSVTFSPDGGRVASSSRDRTVRVWDTASGKELLQLTGHAGPAVVSAFSPDGKLLASAGEDPFIHVRDAATGAVKAKFGGHDDAVWGMAFSPDGAELYTGDADGVVRATPTLGGQGRQLGQHPGRIYDMALSPDGETLGTVGSDGALILWDLQGESGQRKIRGHRNEVNGVAFSPDGKFVVTGGDDRNVRLWDLSQERPAWWGAMAGSSPWLLAGGSWSREGGGAAPRPRAWQAATRAGGTLVDADPDGGILCAVSWSGDLEMWDLKADRRVARAALGQRAAGVVAFADACLAHAGAEAKLLAKDGKVKSRWKEVSSVSRSGKDALVATAGGVVQYNRYWGSRKRYPTGPGASAAAMVGPYLVVGYHDGNMELIPTDGRPRRSGFTFERVGAGGVARIIPGPPGTLVAGFVDGLVGLWSLKNGAQLWAERINGAARYLSLDDGALRAASELGQHRTVDLTLLQRPYCQVMRQVWAEVPVIWRGGLPVMSPPDRTHRCFEAQAGVGAVKK